MNALLENKIAGYYVKGVKDNNGIEYPKRVFDKKTNRWNLDEANKFVDILNYINKNNVDMFRFDIEEIDVNSIAVLSLQYMMAVRTPISTCLVTSRRVLWLNWLLTIY